MANWKDFSKTLNLSTEEREILKLEKQLIKAVVEVREQNGLTQMQLSKLCGVKQSVIARLENSTHSPQINSIIKILKPLGYTLTVVKQEEES